MFPSRLANGHQPGQWEVCQHFRLLFDFKNRSSYHDWRAKARLEPPDHKDQVCFLPSHPACFHSWPGGKNEPLPFPLRSPPYPTQVATVCHLLFQVLTVRNITRNFPFRILWRHERDEVPGSRSHQTWGFSLLPKYAANGDRWPAQQCVGFSVTAAARRCVLAAVNPPGPELLCILGVPSFFSGSFFPGLLSCSSICSLVLLKHIL